MGDITPSSSYLHIDSNRGYGQLSGYEYDPLKQAAYGDRNSNTHSYSQQPASSHPSYDYSQPASGSTAAYSDHASHNSQAPSNSSSSNSNTFQQPRPPKHSNSTTYPSSTPTPSSRSAPASGLPPAPASAASEVNASNSYHHDYSTYSTGGGSDTTHRNSINSMASSNQQQQPYPHQSPHPRASDTSANYTDTPLQPQAPSSTSQQQHHQQGSHSSNNSSGNSNQGYQYAPSHPERTVSGGFDTVKAGPPSPGSKMDLLPFPHHHNQQQSQNSQSSQQLPSSSHTKDGAASSSSRHRSNRSSHHQSHSRNTSSSQAYHPQAQRPNSTVSQIAAQTPAASEQPYHEPVAPSSGRSANSKGSSTTSEFTKRKNWSQRIVEEMQDILHVLSPNGTILFVSPSIIELCGLNPEEMVGRKITDFMDENDVNHFKEEFENSIMTESSLTTYYRLRKSDSLKNGRLSNVGANGVGAGGGLKNLKEEETSDDSGGPNHHHSSSHHDISLSNAAADAVAAMNLHSDSLLLEVTGTPYYTTSSDVGKHNKKGDRRKDRTGGGVENDSDGGRMAEDDNSASSSASGSNPKNGESRKSGTRTTTTKICKCFFAMARPYPSRNNATLDTFLELKIENEKLRMKLADIYREIEGGDESYTSSGATTTAGTGAGANAIGGGRTTDYSGMGMTHADSGSGFQLKNANNQPQPAYFGADPMAIDTLQSQNERQISGFPSRMAGTFAHQQQQGQSSQSGGGYGSASRQGGVYNDKNDQGQYGYGTSAASQNNHNQLDGSVDTQRLRGGPIDSGDGLISSAGLIPSTSNTYGALGIGISANARANAAASSSAATANQDDLSSHGNHANMSSSSAAHASAAAAAAAAADDKKKKMKKQRTDEGEFVCRDCGTVDSPEWRRGPLGPKTLCNACGLRWAKKNKQQQRNSLGGNETIILSK